MCVCVHAGATLVSTVNLREAPLSPSLLPTLPPPPPASPHFLSSERRGEVGLPSFQSATCQSSHPLLRLDPLEYPVTAVTVSVTAVTAVTVSVTAVTTVTAVTISVTAVTAVI